MNTIFLEEVRTKLRNQPNRLNESDGHIVHNGNAVQILEHFIEMSLGGLFLAISTASPITLMGINRYPRSKHLIEDLGYDRVSNKFVSLSIASTAFMSFWRSFKLVRNQFAQIWIEMQK